MRSEDNQNMSTAACLSIIIPIFNSGEYLGKCIDSLLASSGIEDVEIILIDDGSTDSSSRTADKYAKDNPNIKVFHKDNSGPSDSRNYGVLKAEGKYVAFVDSDDQVDPELFSKVIELTKNADADIFLWNSSLIDEEGRIIKDGHDYSFRGFEESDGIITGKAVIEKQIKETGDFVVLVCLGVLRRSFLIDKDLLFEKDLWHEDELWAPKVMLSAKKVQLISDKVYLYRIHKGSITNPKTDDCKKHVESLMYIYPELYKYYDEALAGDPLKEVMEDNLTHRFIYRLIDYDFYRYGYGKKVDKKLLWKTSRRFKDKIKIMYLRCRDLFVRG